MNKLEEISLRKLKTAMDEVHQMAISTRIRLQAEGNPALKKAEDDLYSIYVKTLDAYEVIDAILTKTQGGEWDGKH